MAERINMAVGLYTNDPAYRFLSHQANKSLAMRTMLNDVVRVGGRVEQYADLPEEERMRRYFHIEKKPTPEEIRDSRLGDLEAIENDDVWKRRLVYEAEYARLWRKFAEHIVPKEYRRHSAKFIAYCVRDYEEKDNPEDIDIEFFIQLNCFVTGNLNIENYCMPDVEHEYIPLLFDLYDIWDLVIDDTNKKINRADLNCDGVKKFVLDFLKVYYRELYCDGDNDIHSAFISYFLSKYREETNSCAINDAQA